MGNCYTCIKLDGGEGLKQRQVARYLKSLSGVVETCGTASMMPLTVSKATTMPCPLPFDDSVLQDHLTPCFRELVWLDHTREVGNHNCGHTLKCYVIIHEPLHLGSTGKLASLM